MSKLSDFAKGIIFGFCAGIIIVSIMAGLVSRHKKDMELLEYAERQIEVQALREDYDNRDPYEFLDTPGVRGAADSATAEFERKRDEVLQRFRDGLSSGARHDH
jgi:hypothetical protein